MINDKDVGFGASTVKVTEVPVNSMRRHGGAPRRKIKFVCDNCGEDTIERKHYCFWNVADQRWVVGEWDDCGEDYCSTCSDVTEFTEVFA